MKNLLSNGDFEIARNPAPSPTVTTTGNNDNSGLAAAAAWTTWNNTVPAVTSTELLDVPHPGGVGHVMHVTTNGRSCGIVNNFAPENSGPTVVRSSAWVKLVNGGVHLGTGNGGTIAADVHSKPIADWQLLTATNGITPANELIIYADAGADFLVAHVTIEEVAMPDAKPAPLVALDPAGSAELISYNVPQPASYSGRHFIELQLREEAFLVHLGTKYGLASAVPAPTLPNVAVSTGPLHPTSIIAPPSVVISPDGSPTARLVATCPFALSDRLNSLTVSDALAMIANGNQLVLYQSSIGDLLDYRAIPAPQLRNSSSTLAAMPFFLPDHTPPPKDKNSGRPSLTALLDSPQENSPPIKGTAQGVDVPVSGRLVLSNVVGAPTVEVWLDGSKQKDGSLSAHTYTASVTITTEGTHTITVIAKGQGPDVTGDGLVDVTGQATVHVSVVIDSTDNNPRPTLPRVAIDKSVPTLLISKLSPAPLTLKGTGSSSASPANVVITDSWLPDTKHLVPLASGTWTIDLPLDGYGDHTISAVTVDSAGHSSTPATLTVRLSQQAPFQRTVHRLLVSETLTLSSFLTTFGAGPVIKAVSLLPAEEMLISVKSYTKSTMTLKQGSSIVDSNATDSQEDFDNSMAEEQNDTRSHSEATHYGISGSAHAAWGWGGVSINADYGGAANAARQEAVKNVVNATRKHSQKASSNRTVTVNTEYQVTKEEGSDQSTTRTIKNINVSRTLNFLFRQMCQQHLTLVHLTGMRIGFFTEDWTLDDKGQFTGAPVTNYQECPLPQLQDLLDENIDPSFHQSIKEAIFNMLSKIPDYQGTLQSVVEWVIPKDANGTEMPKDKYLRFPPGLKTDFVDPYTNYRVRVPGIVLSSDELVMRSEAVMVDAILGPGDALDKYSASLQDVAVAERQIAVAERQEALARQQLAREIVTNKDDVGATIFAKVFPPTPPAILEDATASGTTGH